MRNSGLLLGAVLSVFGLHMDGQAIGSSQATKLETESSLFLELGCCDLAAPIDSGQAFAGQQYLIWGSSCYIFKERISLDNSLPVSRLELERSEPLPGRIASIGFNRTRIKWRDDLLWVSGRQKIFKQDINNKSSKHWQLEVSQEKAFADFDIDLNGKFLLICTADPKTWKTSALIEAYDVSTKQYTVIEPPPEKISFESLPLEDRVLYSRLCFGYESIRIQEYLIIFNSFSRRIFIYNGINGTIKELKLPFPSRDAKGLEKAAKENSLIQRDFCWEVIPKSRSEAWLLVPELINSSSNLDQPDKNKQRYLAYILDLPNLQVDDGISLGDKKFPFYTSPKGKLMQIDDALSCYRDLTVAPALEEVGKAGIKVEASKLVPVVQSAISPEKF